MASRTITGVFAFATLLGSGAALAQERGSEAQREACTPDALRLCGQFIPDASRIESCLRDAGPRLSPACYVVFNPPQEQRAPVRTVRRQPQPQPAGSDDDDGWDRRSRALVTDRAGRGRTRFAPLAGSRLAADAGGAERRGGPSARGARPCARCNADRGG